MAFPSRYSSVESTECELLHQTLRLGSGDVECVDYEFLFEDVCLQSEIQTRMSAYVSTLRREMLAFVSLEMRAGRNLAAWVRSVTSGVDEENVEDK